MLNRILQIIGNENALKEAIRINGANNVACILWEEDMRDVAEEAIEEVLINWIG